MRTFDDLLSRAKNLPRKRIALIAPASDETFIAIREALNTLPVHFLLAGDPSAIRNKLVEGSSVTLLPAGSIPEAVLCCLQAVRNGEADILMKGSVDTGSMMKAAVDEADGIRTGRLMSDVFICEYPPANRFLMITDGGLTIAPTLRDKVDLIHNAATVAHALGNMNPRVAVLSASEMVNPSMQSSIDAAALAKMNERGQIKGCVVDGPFALDNAIDPAAAREKGITSPVAGNADILLLPTIEAANALAKSTTYFAGYRLAHVVVGARVPILIPSRADKSDAKLLSMALGMIMSEHRES